MRPSLLHPRMSGPLRPDLAHSQAQPGGDAVVPQEAPQGQGGREGRTWPTDRWPARVRTPPRGARRTASHGGERSLRSRRPSTPPDADVPGGGRRGGRATHPGRGAGRRATGLRSARPAAPRAAGPFPRSSWLDHEGLGTEAGLRLAVDHGKPRLDTARTTKDRAWRTRVFIEDPESWTVNVFWGTCPQGTLAESSLHRIRTSAGNRLPPNPGSHLVTAQTRAIQRNPLTPYSL